MAEPLIRPAQASQIRAAAFVLRDLYADGFIDWRPDGSPDLDGLADQLDGMLNTYSGCAKASDARLVMA